MAWGHPRCYAHLVHDGREGIPLRTLRLTLEYSGARFAGWQIQPDARTVQGELERALAEILREPIRVVGASRTDAGVHATGQTASFAARTAIGCDRLLAGLNALLPDDVAISAVAEAPEGFHARFSALGKHYRYRILSRPARGPLCAADAWHVARPLDLDAMRAAAAALVGRHDFHAFVSRPDGDGDCVRTLHRVDVSAEPLLNPGGGSLVLVDVVGESFLYKMVRTIVGTLAQVGRGTRPPAEVAGLLASRDRRRAGPTAPAHGLTLVRVAYQSGELAGVEPRTSSALSEHS